MGSAKRRVEERRGTSKKRGLRSKDYGQTEVAGRVWGRG